MGKKNLSYLVTCTVIYQPASCGKARFSTVSPFHGVLWTTPLWLTAFSFPISPLKFSDNPDHDRNLEELNYSSSEFVILKYTWVQLVTMGIVEGYCYGRQPQAVYRLHNTLLPCFSESSFKVSTCSRPSLGRGTCPELSTTGQLCLSEDLFPSTNGWSCTIFFTRVWGMTGQDLIFLSWKIHELI